MTDGARGGVRGEATGFGSPLSEALIAEVHRRHAGGPASMQKEAELRMAAAGIAGPQICSCGGARLPAHDGLPTRCLACGKRK